METWLFEIWNSIWLWLCQGIYIFISALYQVFEKVASVNLFSADIFNQLTGKIYIIMAIGMLFIFAYNLVLMIINPDEKKNSGGMNKIVKQSVISIVLVVLLPVIFNWLYIFQTDVLESQVISTIFLGGVGNVTPDSKDCGNDYDCSCDFTNYGLESYNNKKKWTNYLTGTSNTTDNSGQLSDFCKDYRDNKNGSQKGAYAIAPIVFSTFYRPTHFDFDTCVEHLQDSGHSVLQDDDDKKICVNYFYDVTASKYTGNIYPFTSDSYLKEIVSNSDKDGMEFHWIMAIVAGVLAVYMFLCYSMAVGVRVAKLGFLQIISPVAVMMKIVPKKEDIFDKWFKELKNTYLDVFFRVIIIDFSLFAIGLVPDIMSTMWKSNSTGDGNFFIKALSLVFVILGMLKFAQDAPALFKEFFGASGKFSLKSPKKQLSENKLAMGALGAGRTGFGAASRNMHKSMREKKSFGDTLKSTVGGFAGGVKRGAKIGYSSDMNSIWRNSDKAVEDTTDRRIERAKYKALHGGNPFSVLKGHIDDKIADERIWTGADGSRDVIERVKYENDVISKYDDYKAIYETQGYQAMEAKEREYKAMLASNRDATDTNGNRIDGLLSTLTESMKKERKKAITEKSNAASYAAYQIGQALNSNPDLLNSTAIEQFGIDSTFIDQLKDLHVDGNEIKDSNGNVLKGDALMDLMEGTHGLQDALKIAKGKRSNDQGSVAYKHQTQLENERKEKDSKK